MRTTRSLNVLAAAEMVLCLALASSAQNFYGMGSSNVAGVDDWLREFLRITGGSGTCSRISVPGAPMFWIWDHRATDYSPNPETYLQTNDVDVLYMIPSTVWLQRHSEVPPCVGFSLAAVQGNPDARIFIQERWYLEDSLGGPPRYRYFEESWDPTSTTEYLFRPHHQKVACDMASQIGRKVYITPDAASIEGVKDLIEAGLLDEYHSRMDLHAGLQPDSSINWHLSPLGHYVHALALWAAAYHQDPRDLPGVILRYGGPDTMVALTQHDADLIQQVVYDSVKAAAFGGWGTSEPSTYADYMDSLTETLLNFETFDSLDTTTSVYDGSFTGDNGIVWTFHGGYGYSRYLADNIFYLASTYQSGGGAAWLSATIPNGVSQLTFQYRGRYKLPGPADTYKYRLAVVANGDTVARYDKIIENGPEWYAALIPDVNLPPGGELTFVSSGTDFAKIDNIQWKDYNGTVGSVAPGSRQRAPSAPAVGYHSGLLTIGQAGWDRVTVVGIDGRVVASRQCAAGSAVGLWLAPGAYVATVFGHGGSWTAALLVH